MGYHSAQDPVFDTVREEFAIRKRRCRGYTEELDRISYQELHNRIGNAPQSEIDQLNEHHALHLMEIKKTAEEFVQMYMETNETLPFKDMVRIIAGIQVDPQGEIISMVRSDLEQRIKELEADINNADLQDLRARNVQLQDMHNADRRRIQELEEQLESEGKVIPELAEMIESVQGDDSIAVPSDDDGYAALMVERLQQELQQLRQSYEGLAEAIPIMLAAERRQAASQRIFG